jgi:YidC/Oxa1 family membrane protein insertase
MTPFLKRKRTMDYKKILLYVALALVIAALWNAWQHDYPAVQQVASSTTTSTQPSGLPPANVPPLNAGQTAQPIAAQTAAVQPSSAAQRQVIHVRTDVLDVLIDSHGGNIIQVNLPRYPVSSDAPHIPVQILTPDPNKLYVAENGLMGDLGPDTPQAQAVYKPEATDYSLQPGQNRLDVKLGWTNNAGLQVAKVFSFERGKYDISVRYDVDNYSKQPWSAQQYGQLRQKPEQVKSSLFSLHTYAGAAISTTDKNYEKISYSKLEKENLNSVTTGGWLALQQRYFLSAWIPPQDQINRIYSSYDPNQQTFTLGYVGPDMTLLPGAKLSLGSKIYVGPETTSSLKTLAPHLDMTIDYGWLWPISVAIFWVMQQIYKVVGNWGWSIVLVTLLIKLVFYKLSETSYRSMAKMRDLAPRLQAVRERYKDDKQKLGQATMEVYRKEKVNPAGSCLPILIQIPFFIALYYVLIESVELRQAPFILWIHDLSSKDPYYVLPILMGLSMFIQQKLNPPPPDPMQARVMMALPLLFTVLFAAFPAGLVLYWLVNNVLSILQQWYIMRRFEKNKAKKQIKLIKQKKIKNNS